MAANNRQSERFSVDGESTIRDIWQFSQMPASSQFDPQNINAAMAMKRQIRKETRPPDRLSISQYLNEGTPPVREPDMSRAMRRRSANINLQKSIQVLGEAVGTPETLFKQDRQTPGKYRQSSYTPLRLPPDESLDVSAMYGPSTSQGASLLATPRPGLLQQGALHQPAPTFVEMDEDITTSNVALLLEDPGLAACTGLFTEFSASLKANGTMHQIFELVTDYQELCQENTQQLSKLVKRAVPGQAKFSKTLEMLSQLRQEGSTWSLIASLYKDRLEQDLMDTSNGSEPMNIDDLGRYQSEKDVVNTLFEKDSSVRQAQLVVDWLENNSKDQFDVYHRVEFFSDEMGAWENTLHSLRQKRTGLSTGSERPLVTNLDPDAPMRQGKPLADLDLEDESRLLKHVFAFIRSGQLEEAQKLCIKVGQSWRAATLEGWKLYHDPNYASLGPDDRVNRVDGNPCRDLWKSVCWNMSQEDKFDPFERAIYAAFSGNLKQLLPVMGSWEDYVWAYYRVMVDQLVEQEVRVNANSKRPPVDLPENYWEKTLTVEKIFNDIQASANEEIQHESRGHFNVIQKYLILGDIDRLVEEMYEWCKDEANLPTQHLLRFMAHLVLFFRAIGMSTKEELCVSILEAYVRYLIEDRQCHLVATFVATLPQAIQVESYARFLEAVEDTDERKACLRLAEDAGLDIPNITKLVVENIRKRDMTDYGGDPDTPSEVATTAEDRQKIEAIDWLVFDPCQRAEAVRQANAVMRTFLATRKLSAARDVFNKIPPDSIDVVIRRWNSQTGSTELRAEDDNSVREYLCHQAYLDAQDGFNDWFEHFHNAKPPKPLIPAGANFTERVAYEHKEKQYSMDLARWKHNLMMQTKTTQDKIYNVLLFVDGGWMIDQRTDGEIDPNRVHQMRLLRQLCLPTMCFLLHTILHNTEQYKESLCLADIIASEHHQLYKTFRRDELQQLLYKLRESSVALLDSNLDPLGYSLTDVVAQGTAS